MRLILSTVPRGSSASDGQAIRDEILVLMTISIYLYGYNFKYCVMGKCNNGFNKKSSMRMHNVTAQTGALVLPT
jgi:hypothetical protein